MPMKSNRLRRLPPRTPTVRSAPSITVAPGSVPDTSIRVWNGAIACISNWFLPPTSASLGEWSAPVMVNGCFRIDPLPEKRIASAKRVSVALIVWKATSASSSSLGSR